MKIYYDTEFVEDGTTIDLLSIGMVAADGAEYHAVVDNPLTISRAVEHDWLRENVVSSLPIVTRNRYSWEWDKAHPDWPAVKTRNVVASEVRDFILRPAPAGWLQAPELWAWYAAYDHVALCQLWGRMIDLPRGVPMYTNDLKQECDRLGNPTLPDQPAGEHNALADARHNRTRAEFMAAMAPLTLLGRLPTEPSP